jgi:DNA-binding NarL/FixJ family response regulator
MGQGAQLSPVRVLLADDHPLILAAVRALVERIEGIRVVAEARDGREAVAKSAAHRPDLVILDVEMPELNGIEAAGKILEVSPGTKVVMLSSHVDGDYVRSAVRAGASGYLTKCGAPQEINLAIDAAMRGDFYVSSRAARQLIEEHDGRAGRAALDVLTPRQREMLQMIAEGKSIKEIAFVLDLSRKTVETHRMAIMQRLGIHSVAGLATFAVRHGLVPPR